MESYPQLVSLVIILPLVGMIINVFWGSRLGERWSGLIGTTAAVLSFIVAILLYSYLVNNDYQSAVVNPPFLNGWITIPSGDVFIPWQMRVDTLSVTMMLVITGIGSLIHVYSIGYMHGDPRFSRYFAYLNLFFVFMLILVTGNNFLMMFVGWEGVGLCSWLLIGFWFDKARGVGWRNSNAARKAMILNRVGDFGLLMAVFLIFWTFGTLDYYRPGEIANVELAAGGGHGEEAASVEGEHAAEGAIAAEAGHGEEAAVPATEDGNSEATAVSATESGHGEETAADGHGAETQRVYTYNDHILTEQRGVVGQAERFLEEDHQVDFGPFTLPIKTVIVLITLFLLLGATGKSAQIPLFVWLPDAMAGPTPASALIHAATMVTAGVYLMVRSNVLFYNAEVTSLVVTLIGAGTAIMAGYIAMGQWDIKRVLAYSTISQLGFMVAAVGVGAYSAAVFHLVTHAFFKALLFLGSGSVIHGVEHGHHSAHARLGAHGHGGGGGHDGGHDAHGHAAAHDTAHDEHDEHHDDFDPQDMRNMGGLRRRMPITFITYLAGTLALAGIFPFAGFWSKDEILADSWLAALEGNVGGFIAFGVLLLAAAFTAFYMWRQLELVFFGQPRTEAADHAHEAGPLMAIPLLVLGFLSLFGGFFNTPSNVLGLDNLFGAHIFTDFLAPSVVHAHAAEFQLGIALGALALAIGAILLARSIYGHGRALSAAGTDPLYERRDTRAVWAFANARMYWDQTYFRLIENPYNRLSKFLADSLDWAFWHDYFHDTIIGKGFNAIAELLAKPFDLGIIDGAVNGVGAVIRWASGRARRVQTGYVRTYAITLLLGVVLVIAILLLPALTNAGQ